MMPGSPLFLVVWFLLVSLDYTSDYQIIHPSIVHFCKKLNDGGRMDMDTYTTIPQSTGYN